MSRDEQGRWHNDSDQELRYFREPPPGCALSEGFATFVKKDEDEKDEHILPILSWLQNQRAKQSDVPKTDVISCPHFVAWRGMFTRLLCTPYNRNDSWRFLACRFKGTIYIAEKETEESQALRHDQTPRQELMSFWGYKFEDYATRPRGQAEAGDHQKKPVSNIPCYCTMIRARLGSHLILMSGETDCCLEDTNAEPPANYVELKTSKVIESERDSRSFERYKLLKFWSQSFLAGVPLVVVGFRNDDGIVQSVQHLMTLEMPQFVGKKRGMWDPTVCMSFCDRLLWWVREELFNESSSQKTKGAEASDETKVVWQLDFVAPFNEVKATCVEDGSLSFLPAWFIHTETSKKG